MAEVNTQIQKQVLHFDEIKEEEDEEEDLNFQDAGDGTIKNIFKTQKNQLELSMDGAREQSPSPRSNEDVFLNTQMTSTSPQHISSPLTQEDLLFGKLDNSGKAKERPMTRFIKAFNQKQISPKSSMVTEQAEPQRSPKPSDVITLIPSPVPVKTVTLKEMIQFPVESVDAIE